MDREKAIEIIRKELLCVDRDTCKREECKSCDLVMPSKEPIIEAYKMAIKALEQEHILDKIRTEIEEFEEEVFHRTMDYSDYAAVRHCLEIIDKYKAERSKE